MLRFVIVVCLVLIISPVSGAVVVRVVDEQDKPIEQFDAVVQTTHGGQERRTNVRGKNGELPFESDWVESPAINILICAADYAPVAYGFSGESRTQLLDSETKLVLERGQEVRLRLNTPDRMRLPSDMVPQIYFPEFASSARSHWGDEDRGITMNGISVRAAGDGEFVFRLPTRRREFFVGIYRPGWLRFFEAGPFSIEDFKGDTMELDIPRPATIDASFDVADSEEAQPPFDKVRFQMYWRIPDGGGSMRPFASEERTIANATLQIADLAPGNYYLAVESVVENGDKPRRAGEVDPARFMDRREVALTAGETKDVRFDYVPFDENAFRGDRTAAIKILVQDGSPAAGRDVKVGYFDGHYGEIPVHDGAIPTDGIVRLKGITDRAYEYLPFGPYVVEVDGKRLSRFRIEPVEHEQEFEFRLTPDVGDIAPDVELVDLRSNEKIHLHDFLGQIVFVEFWATWCGPCQPAMDKLSALAAGRGEAWEGRVAIVPISIDDAAQPVMAHVEQRGWTNLAQYWSQGDDSRDTSGFFSPAPRAYVVNGVPTALLIDGEGKIVWRGHPMSPELAARIDELIGNDGKQEPSDPSDAASLP